MNGPAETFVGRERELAVLRAALDAAVEGSGRLVMLSGEPGIGKTRLARELAEQAAPGTAHIVWGRCHEEAGAPPYWPWVRILRAMVAELAPDVLRGELGAGAPDIAELVPEMRQRLPDLEPPTSLLDQAEARFRLFGSLTRFLINLSRRQLLVLVLEDLHWADVPSLRLLEFLAPEIADSNLLIIGTYRETELSRRHRLSDTLGALARVPHVERLHLSGLNAEEARRFIATSAGVIPPVWLTRAIHDQTEGNPLFLREMVRFLQQEGHFRADAPDTAVAPPSAIRIPQGVREVIGRRLNLLSPACNEVLSVAAVIGRDFGLDVLARAGRDRNEDAVLEALDEALEARVVEETTAGQYQFSHALLRMTLYDELRTGERRRLHRSVGQAIEALHRRDPDAVLPELARHFHAAGFDDDADRAIDYMTRAGQRADTLLAFEDAIGFFQTALDLLEHASSDEPRRRWALLLQLGEAQRKANDFGTALATLLSSAEIARTRILPVEFAQVTLAYDFTEWTQGQSPGNSSERMLQEALAGLPATEVALQVQLTGRLARAWLHAGSVSKAKELAMRAVAMARALGDPAALATSLSGLADFAWEPHQAVEILAWMTEMLEVAGRAGNLEIVSQAHVRRCVLLLELGDMKQVEADLAAAALVNARIRQPIFSLFELSLRATVALLRGELAEAEQLIVHATRIQRSRVHNTDQLSVLIFALRREQGRLAELRPLVSLFTSQTALAATWRPGLALLYVELGDFAAARAVFDDLAAGEFASLPRDARWSTCLVYLAEVCAALGDVAHAAVLYRFLLPWDGYNVILGGGTGCWGSSGRFLGLLAATMARWTDAERHFTDALAMNERSGSEAALAHTWHDFATMLLARRSPGDRERAGTLLRLADEAAQRLGLVALARRMATRAAPPASAGPDDLTARELEVLRLLAIGRGNADIALVLEISLNTVATHVRNILSKTGCANRTEAAAYAMRHGLHGGQTAPVSP